MYILFFITANFLAKYNCADTNISVKYGTNKGPIHGVITFAP
jgi:hypothetical protein